MLTDDGRGTARARRGGSAEACAPTTEQFAQPIPRSLPTVIRSFKCAATNRINKDRGTPGKPVWQRNYYEHIVRTDRPLNRIRAYIDQIPARWHLDRYNPDAVGSDAFELQLQAGL